MYKKAKAKIKIKFPPIRHRYKILSILTSFTDLLKATCSKIIIKDNTTEKSTTTWMLFNIANTWPLFWYIYENGMKII